MRLRYSAFGMAAGVSRRLGLAAAVVAGSALLATSLVLSADAARSGVPGAELLPDLQVERPAELYVDKNRKETRLRVSNTVSNTGVGPLEIEGDGSECGPGDDGRRTVQRIFKDSGNPDSPGYFVRSHDPVHADEEAGCSHYHPSHDHWHFDNFARYTLYSERTGNPVGSSRKVSFCVIDTGQPYENL